MEDIIYTKTAAIFDLDGTLAKSPGLHEEAWQGMFADHGITLTTAELQEQSGKKNSAFIKLILERRGRNDLDPHELSKEKDALVIAILLHKPADIYPNVKELLKLLRLNGIKIILATSATRKTGLLLASDLLAYFDAMLFAEDIKHGKPDPDIFLTAATLFQLQPSQCIVFEDARDGVAAAKAGRFFCVARDNGLGQDLSCADAIVTEYHPQELLRYF